MKHGRRHMSLKEKVYRERSAQGAPGYKTPYAPIDVRTPDTAPKPLPDENVPLAAKLGRKVKRRLHHEGIDPDAVDDADDGPEPDQD